MISVCKEPFATSCSVLQSTFQCQLCLPVFPIPRSSARSKVTFNNDVCARVICCGWLSSVGLPTCCKTPLVFALGNTRRFVSAVNVCRMGSLLGPARSRWTWYRGPCATWRKPSCPQRVCSTCRSGWSRCVHRIAMVESFFQFDTLNLHRGSVLFSS